MTSNDFPSNPSDSEQLSSNGNVFVFNKEDDTWKFFGYLIKKQIVTGENNGLVSPDIYDRLMLLSLLFKSNNLKSFQLNNNKAYFYLFNNTDHCLKFIFSEDKLFIEINKSLLINKIRSRSFCVGKRGNTGQIGLRGRNGFKAPNEKFVTIIDKKFDVYVKTPLDDQPISVRGFKNNKQEFEVLVWLDGSVDENEYFKYLKFDGTSLTGELINDYKLKIRQRGPIGFSGDDGENKLEVINLSLNNSDVYYSSVLTNFRSANEKLIFNKNEFSVEDNCVFSLKAGNLRTGKLWVGTEITTRECKGVEIVDPLIILEKPILDLPNWTPIPGCYDQRRYEFAKFDWYRQFDLPFDILPDPEPKLNSCAIPFWFCGNSGNAPCDDQIDMEIPVLIGNDYSSSSSSSSSSSYSESESSSQSESSSDSSESFSSSSKSLSSSSESLSSSSSSDSTSSYSLLSVVSDPFSSESSSDSSNSTSSLSTNSISSLSTDSAASNISSTSISTQSVQSEESGCPCAGYSATGYVDGECPGGPVEMMFGVGLDCVPYFSGAFGIYATWNGSQWVLQNSDGTCGPPESHTYLGGSYSCIGGVATGSASFIDNNCSCSWNLHSP